MDGSNKGRELEDSSSDLSESPAAHSTVTTPRAMTSVTPRDVDKTPQAMLLVATHTWVTPRPELPIFKAVKTPQSLLARHIEKEAASRQQREVTEGMSCKLSFQVVC